MRSLDLNRGNKSMNGLILIIKIFNWKQRVFKNFYARRLCIIFFGKITVNYKIFKNLSNFRPNLLS